MSAREETVLAPIDPSLTDENDWWEFDLSEVKVLRPGKMLYANLLDASDQNPVQVIGCLEQLRKEQEHLVLDPDNVSRRMIIDDVTHYAYGQTEDSSVEIWVAGKAGWYRIAPAKGYLPTFTRMVQAIDMLYFLVDRHQQGRKQLNPSFRNLCEQYVYHSHGSSETREQSAEAFAEHASFLLRCMIKGEEDIEWKKTNVFVHLRRQFSEEYQRIMAQASPEPEETETRDQLEASTPRHEPAAVAKSQADAIYQLIKDLREEGYLAKRLLHLDLLTERLSSRHSFSNEDARKIIAARASAVVEMMDAEDNFRWSRYVIHRELTHATSKYTHLPPALLTPLHPIDDSSDDENLGRVQTSVLRPKTTSKSSKVMGKRHRNTVVNQKMEESEKDDDDDDDEDIQDAVEDLDTPSKTRGHELIRDPFSSAKPPASSILPDSEPSSLMKNLLQETLQTQTPALSSTNHDVSDISTNHDVSDIEPMHTEDSNSLSGPWTCRMPGCTKVIVLSDGKQRQTLIEEHALEHDWETQMRVELVESERRMHSTLPVSNLMQYLVSQHYQQMRTAFPELHAAKNGNGATDHPDISFDDKSALTPIRQRLAEKIQSPVTGTGDKA
ncbi:hypothetical protein NUU61_004032 [Penicillium alfredii]|uniref:DNA (cytosine-5)-methyltransferase 1 replication foci domain-containing protein n=1 Tax=Penicillium alfredii TaxID=1506179 RepID=A0A9W9FKK1_9EURO|nr:uncharacterized protein NUU61_004032 [Penicillium alfredii]KAJ5101810.1 hypothetical protein NUU61_004032 [Penicillium alfredii]